MIVVDVESSGIDPLAHSIVAIGAVDFHSPKRQFYEICRVWAGSLIMPETIRITGFSEKDMRDEKRKTLEDIVRAFFEWSEKSKDKTLAGQNTSFDRDFLESSAKRYGLKWPFGYRTLDLHTLCYSHMMKRGLLAPSKESRSDLTLNKILHYVGLPTEPEPHLAINGARMEAEAFSRIIYGRPHLAEYKSYHMPDFLKYG